MKIVFNRFNGILPRVNVGIKPDNCAKVAWNCDLRDGRLRPLKQALNVGADYPVVNADYTDADDGSVVRHLRFVHRVSGDVILWWASEKEVAEANVDATNEFRCIVSGYSATAADPAYIARYQVGSAVSSKPSVTALIKSRLPAPGVSILYVQGEANTYTTFKQTWVDANGFESPLSEPSPLLNYFDDGTLCDWIQITQTVAPLGAVARRIYKSLADEAGEAVYQFIYEQVTSTGAFPALTLNLLDKDAGGVAPDVDNPPETLGGIVAVYGGFYAGFDLLTRREVLFSDVDLPYVWPLANRISTVDQTVVRLVSYGNSVLVLTDDIPLVFTGTSPDMMTVASTATHAPCVSRRSVVQIGASVVFASDDGLYTIPISGESQVTNLTQNHYDRKAWRDLHPETSFGITHNNQIFMWFPNATDPVLRCQRYIFDDGLSTATTHDELCEAAVMIPDRGIVMLRRA
jgi:hypothetical protein